MLPSMILAGLLASTTVGPQPDRKMDDYTAFGFCRSYAGTVVKILDLSGRGLTFDEALLMVSTIDAAAPELRDVLQVTVRAIYSEDRRMASMIEAGQWPNGCVIAVTQG